MIWFNLALRNVFANHRRSLMAVGAVAIAVIALLLYADYINAVRTGLQYSTIHGGTGHLQISGEGGFDRYSDEPLRFALTKEQFDRLEALTATDPRVRRVVPRLEFGGLISNGPRTLSFSGLGVDAQSERTAFGVSHHMVAGHWLADDGASDEVVVGAEMARRMGVHPGDNLTILTPTVSGALNAVDVTVVGIETTGTPQSDLFYLRARLATVQSLLVTDKLSNVALLLDEDADPSAVGRDLVRAVPGTEFRDWLQLTPIYTQIVGIYESQFRVFGAFIIAITMFGLATIVLTNVMERTREIGTLRALGITRLSVRTVFMLEAFVLMTLGLAIGSMAGALLDNGLNAVHITMPPPPGRTTGYPLRLLWDWEALGLTWGAVLVMGALTGWLASGRIARLRIVDALGAI